MIASRTLSKKLVVGIALISLCTFGYMPVVNQFYYGGGWPFVQLIFLIIYMFGVRYISKSPLAWWTRWLIYLAPFIYAAIYQVIEDQTS